MATFDRKEAERIAAVRIERQYQAVEHPANRQAMEELRALMSVPGALKIITSEVDPQGKDFVPSDPRYFVAHDVVKIEGPDHNGNVWAYSKEGDHCHGHAHAVLGRLTQYSRAAPFSEERQDVSPRGSAAIRQARPIRRER